MTTSGLRRCQDEQTLGTLAGASVDFWERGASKLLRAQAMAKRCSRYSRNDFNHIKEWPSDNGNTLQRDTRSRFPRV